MPVTTARVFFSNDVLGSREKRGGSKVAPHPSQQPPPHVALDRASSEAMLAIARGEWIPSPPVLRRKPSAAGPRASSVSSCTSLGKPQGVHRAPSQAALHVSEVSSTSSKVSAQPSQQPAKMGSTVRKQVRLKGTSIHDLIFAKEKEQCAKVRQDGGVAFEGMAMDAALVENEMLRSIYAKVPHKLVDIDERIEIAGIFARHAKARTPVGSVDWSSPFARRIYVLRYSGWYKFALKFAFVGLLLVAIWEPAMTFSGVVPEKNWLACTMVELSCLVVFVIDLGLAISCAKWRFASNVKNVIFALLVLGLLADALSVPIVAFLSAAQDAWYPWRWSRCLRPLLLPYLSKTCAHMATSIAHTVPSLADLALCVLAAVLFYSLLAASLFGTDLQSRLEAAEASNASSTSGPELAASLYFDGHDSSILGSMHKAVIRTSRDRTCSNAPIRCDPCSAPDGGGIASLPLQTF